MSKDKVVHALGAVVACFVLVMVVTPPIPQPQKYHDFADKRTFYAASGLGSAYYHLNPNDARLAWDRWPMAVTFASLVATLITERIDEKKGIISIAPLNIGAISAVVYWRQAYFPIFAWNLIRFRLHYFNP
ncbi:hypothetical protein PIB30_010864 [Stylosanthes scabra]|uniref:Uncharacterized protein n=1 Tax=Stylosanthes scabra TaxID=79078 RepID=A0ABU6R4M6_9FABA|nr:hypothetical protein [Stylosanthes scabra]